MTDDELKALSAELSEAVGAWPEPISQEGLVKADLIVRKFLLVRKLFREADVVHMGTCNSQMCWGDMATCDCPRDKLVHALLGGGS